MMTFSRQLPRNFLQKLLMFLVLLLGGCAGVSFDYPKIPSYSELPVSSGPLAELPQLWLEEDSEKSAVYPLYWGAEALELRLDLIDRAKSTIDAQYFLIKGDRAGSLFTGALLRAADRGVRVRFLLDDIFTTGVDDELALFGAHENIELRMFNPLSRRGFGILNYALDFHRANRRMHNKSFTVDGQVSIVGGRNIADEYFELNPKVDFWDFEFLAFGPLVAEVAEGFDIFWNHELSQPIEAVVEPGTKKQLKQLRSEVEVWSHAREVDNGDSSRRTHLIDKLLQGEIQPDIVSAHVVTDHPDKLLYPVSSEFQVLGMELGSLIESAQHSVVVISPYFIPHTTVSELFIERQQVGVQIYVLTNSLASTNHIAVHSAYSRYRKPLLEEGVKIYEVRASTGSEYTDFAIATLHTKAILVDERWVYVGSLNVDPRSIDINTEMGLIIDSPDLAVRLTDAVADSVGKDTWQVELTTKGELQWRGQIGNDESRTNHEPESTWFQRLKSGFFGLLPIEKQL